MNSQELTDFHWKVRTYLYFLEDICQALYQGELKTLALTCPPTAQEEKCSLVSLSCVKELPLILPQHKGNTLKQVSFQHTVTALHCWRYAPVCWSLSPSARGMPWQNISEHHFPILHTGVAFLNIYLIPGTTARKAKVCSHFERFNV